MINDATQDARGTHFDWSLDGVTPRMIDWFWSNIEKGFMLWHPEQHEALEWPVPPRHGDSGENRLTLNLRGELPKT